MAVEREKGILDTDTKVPTAITAHAPGYIDKTLEKIVGLQTDQPLKRAIMPLGGIRVVKSSLEAYGYQLDKQTKEEGQTGGFQGSATGSSVYAGGNRAEGGLMLKKGKKKKKK